MTRADQQLAWIERLRQLRRDRARRAEQDCLLASEAATNDRLQVAARLEFQRQCRSQTVDGISGNSIDALRLTQFAHRQDWIDKELQHSQFELARAMHRERSKRAAADEATRHAMRQSIQYEKVVEWRKST